MIITSLRRALRRTKWGSWRGIATGKDPVRTWQNDKRRNRVDRRAVAAVEAAVSLPLLLLLVFGSIEVSNAIFLTQALSFASYEGAREATRPGSTVASVNQRVAEVLGPRGINQYTVTITPVLTTSTARGTMVTVQVTAPTNSLSTYTSAFTGGGTKTQQVSMVKH
jgi:Flp pilus assembly protein TadG